MVATIGSPVVHVSLSSRRQTQDAQSSVPAVSLLGQKYDGQALSRPGYHRDIGRPTVLVNQGQFIVGSVIRDSDSRPPLHGCVFGGVGSIQPGQGSEQRVVPPGEIGAHQLFGVESNPFRSSIL